MNSFLRLGVTLCLCVVIGCAYVVDTRELDRKDCVLDLALSAVAFCPPYKDGTSDATRQFAEVICLTSFALADDCVARADGEVKPVYK